MPEVVNTSALTVEDETAEIEDNRPVMIDVDHVSMSFNMASEQLNNLKEYAIAIARGKLFFEEFKALDDVSFKVRKGDVFGIMGTNGSGKSTILKIIAGVLEPTKGKCTVNGNIAPLIELGAGFDMDLSARENIYLNGALLGYSKQFIDEHFQEIVEFAEVEKFLDMPLKNYSSGMVARIAFAIATVIVPEILVVDEVLSVGDFMFQKKCEDRITQLIEEYGVTVLIVSHSNDQIARLCNKAVWIEKGHVRIAGDAKMVSGLYSSLGGRTGSKESELFIADALRKAHANSDQLANRFSVVAGETSIGTSNKLIEREWRGARSNAVALVADNTHVNAIIANGFAGAMGMPVITIGGIDGLSDSADSLLRVLEPSDIFLFACDWSEPNVIERLESLPSHPHVVWFGKGRDALRLSSQVFEYGNERNIWKECASFFLFKDNAVALTASPFVYSIGCPVFIAQTWEDCFAALDDLSNKNGGIKQAYCFGSQSVECEPRETTATINWIGSNCGADSCIAVARFVQSRFSVCGKPPSELCLASSDASQWPELLACGCYGARNNAALLLMNRNNLDHEKECFEFIADAQPSLCNLTFIGDRMGLSSDDRLFLASALSI